jgi:hypothetical protein
VSSRFVLPGDTAFVYPRSRSLPDEHDSSPARRSQDGSRRMRQHVRAMDARSCLLQELIESARTARGQLRHGNDSLAR